MNPVAAFAAAIVVLSFRLSQTETIVFGMLVFVLAATLFLLGAGFAVRWAVHWVMGTPADPRSRMWLFYKWAVVISGGAVWLLPTVTAITGPVGPRPEPPAIANLRKINTAEVVYLSAHDGNYGTLPELISAGLLDSRFGGSTAGYVYNVTTDRTQYTATALPASLTAGNYGYYSWADAVLRYAGATTATCMPCYPSGKADKPVE